ncbi:hypothetical protein AB0B12_25905 [Streptomyces sp. NPDC044780]|uniref:NucA/NucB deoxyribonuclease domain-containing protein n=1 Tax=unclassified Streptomyces TaxID=2593676 RepID=UPI0033C47391
MIGAEDLGNRVEENPLSIRTSASESCISTTHNSAQQRVGIAEICTRDITGTDTINFKGERSQPLTKSAAASGLCDQTPSGTGLFNRFGLCVKERLLQYVVKDNNGKQVGDSKYAVTTDMSLNATSLTWSEDVTVTVKSVTGIVSALNVAFEASCASPCSMSKASPWTGTKTLGLGQSASGTVTYKETLASNTRHTFTPQYQTHITHAGVIPVDPTSSWASPSTIRCDSEVGSNPGCVFPDYRANLELPISQYGAAAITYLWAQLNLPDGWGDATPLRRLGSTTTAEANRRATCEDGTFSPLPSDIVADDSCDEYPFAGTYEGGTAGGLCADIAPILENGQWEVYQANPNKPVTLNEPCVRGHVPSGENKAAGGKLGSFVQTDRVLETEKFNVVITA